MTQTHASTSAATLKAGVGSLANPSCDDDVRHRPAHPQPSPLLSRCHGLRLTELLNSCLIEEPHGSYGRYHIILLILEELAYCFHSGTPNCILSKSGQEFRALHMLTTTGVM